jgi:phenylacetate-CoA ligase
MLLHNAYENVPHYRKIFKEKHFLPEDMNQRGDLAKFPLLDRATFKLHFNEIVPKNVETRNLPLGHTAGTTGKPIQFYQSNSENVKEWATICYQWARVGYRPSERGLNLEGFT